MEKYSGHLPANSPSRVEEELAYVKRLQLGDARRYPQVHYLRRNKEFRRDKQEVRRILGIPPEGYGIRAAKEKLRPFWRAYLDCENKVRGNYKHRAEAGVWAYMVGTITKFAKRHPLRKNISMPLRMAFAEIVYHKPKFHFQLSGYYSRRTDGGLDVCYEDGSTRVPQPIKRLVSYRLRDQPNVYTKIVLISKSDSASGYWKITKIPTESARTMSPSKDIG